MPFGLLLSGVLSGCSSNLGEAVRPKEGTAGDALGEGNGLGACEADYAKPLVIDISPEDRGDLEAKLKQGGPVVHFDCKSMKVLPTCRMNHVHYKWVGYTPKAQLVEMESGDDLGAALPLNGMSFKAALNRSGRLNLATMTVGQRSAGMMAVDPENLEGDCKGATHVVNSVWVGAFKLETGTKGEVAAAADVFGASAHAESSSSRKAMTSDGDVNACQQAREDGTAPPSGCTAFVRLELLKIPPKGTVVQTVAESDEAGGGNGEKKEVERPVTCPPGRTWNGVVCVSEKPASTTCSPVNLGPCAERCDKKDGAACFALTMDAQMHQRKDDARKFAEKACNFGEERGCSERGWIAMSDRDDKASIDWFSKGCFGGHASSCSMAGSRLKSGGEAAKAFSFRKRACDLGDISGCQAEAQMLLTGDGTTKDVQKGSEILEKQCRTGKSMGCTTLANELQTGRNMPKDLAGAEKWLRIGCGEPGGTFACMALGDLLDKKGDKAGAKKQYDIACDQRFSTACTKAGRPAPSGPPGPPGPPPPRPPPPPPPPFSKK